MTRIKVLGLAALAVLAVSAVSASGAQAAVQQFHCTSTSANCFITGASNIGELTIAGGTVKCTEKEGVKGAVYSSTIAKTASSAIVNATYSNCKAFGSKATVKMNECSYTFNSTSEAEATATVDVNCPGSNKIEIVNTALPCTVTVGSQTGLAHVTFTNSGEESDVTANVTVTGIAATKVQSTCPEGAGAATAGLTDTVTLQGYEDNAGAEGSLVGLHVF